jgi:hypothetical protein
MPHVHFNYALEDCGTLLQPLGLIAGHKGRQALDESPDIKASTRVGGITCECNSQGGSALRISQRDEFRVEKGEWCIVASYIT